MVGNRHESHVQLISSQVRSTPRGRVEMPSLRRAQTGDHRLTNADQHVDTDHGSEDRVKATGADAKQPFN